MNIWKHAPSAVLAAALLAPLPGAALSLGEITVHSYMGYPFRATIPLRTAPGEEVDITCFRLAPPPNTEGMTYLRHAQLSLSRRGENWQLLVTGSNALNDPYISILIENSCQDQGSMVREYTVLIDPPTSTVTTQAMEETMQAAPESPAPTPKQTQTRAAAKAGVAHSARHTAKHIKPAIARKKLVPHTAPTKGRLKVMSSVSDAPAKPDQPEKERLQQREKDLTRELDDKTAQFLALQTKLTMLESKLSDMQKTIALQNRIMASLQRPPAAPQKPDIAWANYWPAGPGILLAGMIYLLARRSRKRSLENWEPLLRESKSRKVKNPF